MAPLNKGISTYHSIQALYWRESNGTLLAVEGSNSKPFPEAWPQLQSEICSGQGSWTHLSLPSGKQINTLHITSDIPALNHIRSNFPPSYREEELYSQVAEIEHPNGLVLGMLTSRPKSLAGDAFNQWAENFILLETQFQPFARLSDSATSEHRKMCETIAEIFERRLKNLSKDDQWDACGRDSFLNRVYGFVEKNLPILLGLPAYPCKSSSPNKVGGTMPDLAEHISMDVLRDFVKEVSQVYKPGATLWIISDGHVFSDCIGVNDALIDAYDARMIEIYKNRYPAEEGPVPTMQFKGLKNIFATGQDSFHTFQDSWLASHDMPHPVKTEVTREAEMCRKLMLGVAEADRKFIRQCIEEQEPDALSLYRGQTRFMLEDLADVPSVKSLSMKQRKKTAANVAQEMMSRNQAYSNLVELLLPNYVRLSIHAHNNKGPKFAIRLLPKHMVRAIDCLENRFEPVPAYEFQLPTPWHNCIIKVEGDELLYLARSSVAKKALAGPEFTGSWVDGPDGAYFSLKRTTPATPVEATAPALPAPTPVETVKPIEVIKPVKAFRPVVDVAAALDSKKPMVIVSTPIIQPLRRVDSHFVRSMEKNKLRFFIPLYPTFRFNAIMKTVWRYFALGSEDFLYRGTA